MKEMKTLNGYEIVDEKGRHDLGNTEKKVGFLSTYVTPEMFGAKGDGVTNDTEAIKQAIAKGNVCLTEEYLVTEPILIPEKTHIYGGGKVIKKNSTTATVGSETVNAIFILNGAHIIIENCSLSGSIDSGVTGIAFGNQAIMFRIANTIIYKCLNGFTDVVMCFMGAFENVLCQNCENGFAMTNIEKTSLTFKNCWCENCGQAYDFKLLHYTSLMNCGADYCNYVNDSNPYGESHGSKTTTKGIYTFNLCRNVSLINCGMENCYAMCAVRADASILAIDGLTVTNLEGECTSSVGYKYGAIYTSSERSRLSIKNIYVNGYKNIPYTNAGNVLGIVGFNYDETGYGAHDGVDVTLDNYSISGSGYSVFVGKGNYSKYCTDLTMLRDSLVVKKLLSVGYAKTRASKTVSGSGNTIVIPFTSQVEDWRTQHFSLYAHTTVYNDSFPDGYNVTIVLSSLNSLKSQKIIETSDENITVSVSGMNLYVKLPKTFTKLSLNCTDYSIQPTMEWDSVSLSET